MHPDLIVIAVLVGWALGPLILRVVGVGCVGVGALALLAGDHDQFSPLLVAFVGGLAYLVGTAWQIGREAGRGPLFWSLLVDLAVPALSRRRDRRRHGYADDSDAPALAGERFSSHDGSLRRARRWRSPFRDQRAAFRARLLAAGESAPTPGERAGVGEGRRSPSGPAVDPTVIDGTAHDLSMTVEEDEAARVQRLREDVDRSLEEARRYLEPIVYELFVLNGAGWRDRLSAARWKRRKDLPEIDGSRPFGDRRTLFSVIAYDWGLIGSAFMRDPSRPGRALCAICNRYAHEGPRPDDAAAVRRACGQICAALRPDAVDQVMGQTNAWNWKQGARRRGSPRGQGGAERGL
jgi:hypothetical protein